MEDGKFQFPINKPRIYHSMSKKERLQEIDDAFDWTTYVTRENTMLWRYIEALGYRSSNVKDEVGYASEIQCKLTRRHLMCQEESIQKMMGLIAERVEEDVQYFNKVAEDCYDACERFLALCQGISQEDESKLNNQEAASRFKRYVDCNTDVIAYREVVFFLDILLDEVLSEALSALNEDVTLHLDMIAPKRDLPFMKERKALLKLAQQIESDEDARSAFDNENPNSVLEALPAKFKSAVADHTAEYGWVTTARYTGTPLSEEDVIRNLRDVVGRAHESLKSLEQDRRQKEAELEKIKAKGDRIRTLLEIAQEYAYLRTYRMDAIFEGDFLLRDFFVEIADRAGVEYRDLIQLTVPEIISTLHDDSSANKLKSLAEVRRNDSFVVYLINDELTVGEGADVEGLVDDNEAGKEDTAGFDARTEKRIQGRVAQRGEVTARVKIVRSEEQVDKVNNGDILVSPMTTPDMTVGIAKADGIITDEGGVASHAAIISREFGIPCLIGTEIATSVLQDGDKVKLNAKGEEGTARLIQETA